MPSHQIFTGVNQVPWQRFMIVLGLVSFCNV
jgi:hypothetical protein